jgi:hypothetical protein
VPSNGDADPRAVWNHFVPHGIVHKMIITTCEHIAPVSKAKAPMLATVVADPTRPVSIIAELAHQLDIAAGPEVPVTPNFVLRGVDLTGLPREQTLALNKLVEDAGKSMLGDLQAANPLLGGGIDGYELVVATARTYEAWTDPNGVSPVKAGRATVKALKEAMDVLNRMVPSFGASRFAGTATLILSVAGTVFQLAAEISPSPASVARVPSSTLAR